MVDCIIPSFEFHLIYDDLESLLFLYYFCIDADKDFFVKDEKINRIEISCSRAYGFTCLGFFLFWFA